jgi:hypothetical protein
MAWAVCFGRRLDEHYVDSVSRRFFFHVVEPRVRAHVGQHRRRKREDAGGEEKWQQ